MEKQKEQNKMKKVMIALAVTAVAGIASAASCTDCPFGYRLKVMVRTTASCNVVAKDACNECSTATYRGPVIRRFMGMVYGTTATEAGICGDTGCACNDWKDTANVAFFDYDNAGPMILDADTTELIQLNRIGCKAEDRQKAEMAFTVGFKCNDTSVPAQMTFAGFGLCGNHDGKITLGAVSGYCAGLLPAGAVISNGPCADPTTVCGNYAWNLCCNTQYLCAFTAAYGKWTLVWDAGITDKVGTNLTEAQAKTGWGTATPVKLADGRACSDVACSVCVE